MSRRALLVALIAWPPALAHAGDPTDAPAAAGDGEPAHEPDPGPAPEPDPPVTWNDIVAVENLGHHAGSVRSMSSSWLIRPPGWEASGELRFLTAHAAPGGEPMRMTDVVVSRASLRRSFRGKLELAGGVDALPKQPSTSDELVFQGADLVARLPLGTRWALYAGDDFGPLTEDRGWWNRAGAGVQRRARVHDTLSFQLGLGAAYTHLAFAGAPDAQLVEAVVRGQTLFMAEELFGVWLGADFAFPVARRGALMGSAFDPQPRVNLGVGAVYSVVDDWDVYLELSIVDRGDHAAPATQLPILQGGFDQRVLTFGLTRHFGGDDHQGGPSYLAF
jgi:hypothetical protein